MVPRDRYLHVGGDKHVDKLLLAHLRTEDLPRFTEYSDNATARMIGQEMLRRGAITKTELPDDDYRGHAWRYRAAVILPRRDDDNR
ncbi:MULTISPECIES: hypothetical protein [unclassified Bradyrhizobium]|uniref:hypothetical protein n=1 Tax=unclassified Bradyrhizobium TaxID=2631580 RepID=UPI00291646B2|nr:MULTISPECIES: hypothetical protein [unclassified Bradyrhizobium]